MIVVALDNEKFFNELNNVEDIGNIYKYDIQDMESVIEVINKYEEVTLITKDTLNGRFTKELYIKQIKFANKNIKVILLTEILNEEYKSFLFANEIFNIIESESIDFNKILNVIYSKENIIYKKDNKENVTNVFSKQMIAVYGSSGAGKSYISFLLAKKLAKLNINTLLLDMDFQNSCQDIYLNTQKQDFSIMDIVEDIDKKRNIKETIFDKVSNKNKLKYISANTSIFNYKTKINKNYYNLIYPILKNKFDCIVVDLPSSPFLDIVQYSLNEATKVIFVVNPNYISLRQSIKYLELINKLYGVPKYNIDIIINKKIKGSIPTEMIKNILNEYNIKESIDFNNDLEGYINGNNNIDFEYNFTNIMSDMRINYNKNEFNIKNKIMTLLKERKFIYDN